MTKKERKKKSREIRFCGCNCGGSKEVPVDSTWKYFAGHNVRVNNPMRRPGARAEHSVIMKVVGKRPEVKANRSAAQKLIQKEIHSRPGYRDKVAHKGENNGMFGVHRFGESAPNWQGGISILPYGFGFNKELKESIRKRDNYTCQLCGRIEERDGRALCVHHINYGKEDLFELNLITLCRGCNGRANSQRDLWKDYFTFKLMTYKYDRVLVVEI